MTKNIYDNVIRWERAFTTSIGNNYCRTIRRIIMMMIDVNDLMLLQRLIGIQRRSCHNVSINRWSPNFRGQFDQPFNYSTAKTHTKHKHNKSGIQNGESSLAIHSYKIIKVRRQFVLCGRIDTKVFNVLKSQRKEGERERRIE